MKKPDAITYFLGLPQVGLMLLAACIGFAFSAINTKQADLILCIPFLVAAVTLRTMIRVSRYRQWKREWDALNGIQVDPKKGKALRNFISWLIMLGLLYFVPRGADPKLWDLCAAIFAAATIISLLVWIVKRIWAIIKAPRPQKAATQAKAQKVPTVEEMEQEKTHIISICPSSPWSSPKVCDMYAQLPDYCKTVLSSFRPGK